MLITVPKEILPDENRVALIPASISALTKAGMEVMVESGAGAGCFYSDQAYEEAGAKIAPNAETLYSSADIVFKVRPPESAEVDQLSEGAALICLMDAFSRLDLMEQLAANERKSERPSTAFEQQVPGTAPLRPQMQGPPSTIPV